MSKNKQSKLKPRVNKLSFLEKNSYFSMLRWKRAICIITLLIVPFTLTSCGSGASQTFAGGGISGTGISAGRVTGFGSLIVNGTRINTDVAQFIVDGNQNATQSDIEIGMKVVIRTANGVATTVRYESEVAGPLELVNPGNQLLVLEVMGQTVNVDSLAGTTEFKGFNVLADLQAHINEDVQVSGLFNADGDIHASFIELVTQPLQSNKVKGTVESLDTISKRFKLSQLIVDYSGIPDPGIQDGSFVKVEGNYQGILRLLATKLEMDTASPSANPDWNMEIEGIITLAPPSTPINEFELNGRRVQTNAQTIFQGVNPFNITLNVRVTVRGALDNNGMIIASEVEFH